MRCDDARRLLRARGASTPTGARVAEARAHAAQCTACLDFFLGAESAIRARVRRATASTAAPSRLRRRIVLALEHDAVRARRRRLLVTASSGAVAMVAALAIAITLLPNSDLRRLAEPLAREAHADVSRVPSGLASTEHARVSAWLESHLGHRVLVPTIADAELLGARLARVNGVPVAAIVYRYHGMPLTYFALRSEVVGSRSDTTDVWAYTVEGYEVALWWEGQAPRAVAAQMPRDEVISVARQCRSGGGAGAS